MDMKRRDDPKHQRHFHPELMLKLAASEFPAPEKRIVPDRSWLHWQPQARLSPCHS